MCECDPHICGSVLFCLRENESVQTEFFVDIYVRTFRYAHIVGGVYIHTDCGILEYTVLNTNVVIDRGREAAGVDADAANRVIASDKAAVVKNAVTDHHIITVSAFSVEGEFSAEHDTGIHHVGVGTSLNTNIRRAQQMSRPRNIAEM